MSPELPKPQGVAIVTGGARGIGRAIVEDLARAGMHVVFTYVSSEHAAAALVHDLAMLGHRARAVRVDARDARASEAMVLDVLRTQGRLDVLVHNAAITRDRLLPALSLEDWTEVLSTSLTGLYGVTKPAAAQMMRQRAGRIVNMSSVSGLMGIAGQTNYAAAKAGILGFTRALAKEMANWGVSVNAVAPGFVDTDMLSSLSPEQRERSLSRVPMQRFASSQEIARVVRFLALESPSYLTGQTIVIDGGLTA